MRRLPLARHVFPCVAFVLVLAGAAVGWPGGALAQATGPAMTPDEIAACLCQKQAMDQQRASLDAQGALLQERQLELSNLDTEIKRQAAALSSGDTVGQQVLQDLIGQQIALRNLIQLQIRPAYNRQVGELTQVIQTYNTQCTTRPRYKLDVDQAEQTLSCPAQ
jgi:uncharacterized protein YbaP (TraB family)